MNGFVIDASALLELLAGDTVDPELHRAARTGHGAAPELIDVEIISIVRRLVSNGIMAADEGAAVVRDLGDTAISRTSHRPLLPRIWELRHAITAYDAAYIALAEHLGVPLLTCDARLSRANGHRAEVLVHPRS